MENGPFCLSSRSSTVGGRGGGQAQQRVEQPQARERVPKLTGLSARCPARLPVGAAGGGDTLTSSPVLETAPSVQRALSTASRTSSTTQEGS